MDGHVGDVLGLEIFADVDFVFRRHDDFADAAASGASTFSLMPPTGRTWPVRVISRSWRGWGGSALRKHRHQRGGHRDAGGGAVFGMAPAARDVVSMDLKKLGSMPLLGGGAAHPGEGGLRIPALRSQLAGHDEALAAAGHAAGFDEEDVAADGGPGEATATRAGACARPPRYRCGSAARRGPAHSLRRTSNFSFFSWRPSAMRRACLRQYRAEFALQATHSRFTRVAADQEAHASSEN